jgi:hypothetical protein
MGTAVGLLYGLAVLGAARFEWVVLLLPEHPDGVGWGSAPVLIGTPTWILYPVT